MDIAVVGAGVVGSATGKGFARLGHDVTFCDIDAVRCNQLKEEGYDATQFPSINSFDIAFFCVPEKVIVDAVNTWEPYLGTRPLLVIRSTVIPGSTEQISDRLNRHMCFNPEFLRESVAEYEFLNPPGVIIGECCKEHGDKLRDLYQALRVPIVRVNRKTAEMTKIVINSYLACQISFWNQVSAIADSIGVNSHEVGMLASFCDERVSQYGARMHGKAYGGKCLPKDLQQLLDLANREHVWAPLMQCIKNINEEMAKRG